MAKAQVSKLLKELEKVADKDIARGILDYQTQYVLMYVEDIAIAFEEIYAFTRPLSVHFKKERGLYTFSHNGMNYSI